MKNGKKTIHDIRSTLDMMINFLNLLDGDDLEEKNLSELRNLLKERIVNTYDVLENLRVDRS
ncbi:hypothetical protein N9N67_07725 [Bacteriovoracaceae bacterium]|nr:hypothetical protein [Bacteriovoracaceae bacterium]